MQEERVNQAVASICDHGCKYVSAILQDDGLRRDCSELQALGSDERRRVLDELAEVMAVYDLSGNCEV